MDKWFKDILPDKDPYHNRGRNQMRKKGGPEFECLWVNLPACVFDIITVNGFTNLIVNPTHFSGNSETLINPIQGRILDFKLGGAHLKKLRRAEGGAKIFGVFRVKNHDFTPKNHIPPPPESAPAILVTDSIQYML